MRQKLNKHRPETLGLASRISGVTPAAISLLLVHLKKSRSQGFARRPGSAKVVRLMRRSSRPALRDGLQQLGLALTDAQVGQLLDYLALIRKWNKVYNLTAVRDPAEMLTHHLLDSLAVIGPLRRQTAGQADQPAGCRLGRRTAGRGDRDLLPETRGGLRRHGRQEGGLRPAGGGHAGAAEPARRACPGREPRPDPTT